MKFLNTFPALAVLAALLGCALPGCNFVDQNAEAVRPTPEFQPADVEGKSPDATPEPEQLPDVTCTVNADCMAPAGFQFAFCTDTGSCAAWRHTPGFCAESNGPDETGMRFVGCPVMAPPDLRVGPPGPGDFHPVDPVEPDPQDPEDPDPMEDPDPEDPEDPVGPDPDPEDPEDPEPPQEAQPRVTPRPDLHGLEFCIGEDCEVFCDAGFGDPNGHGVCDAQVACGNIQPAWTDGVSDLRVQRAGVDGNCSGNFADDPLLTLHYAGWRPDIASGGHLNGARIIPPAVAGAIGVQDLPSDGLDLDCWSEDTFVSQDDGGRLPRAQTVVHNRETDGFVCGSYHFRNNPNARDYVVNYEDALGFGQARTLMVTLAHDVPPGESGEIVRVGGFALGISVAGELTVTWNGEARTFGNVPRGDMCTFGIGWDGNGTLEVTVDPVNSPMVVTRWYGLEPLEVPANPTQLLCEQGAGNCQHDAQADGLFRLPAEIDGLYAWTGYRPVAEIAHTLRTLPPLMR